MTARGDRIATKDGRCLSIAGRGQRAIGEARKKEETCWGRSKEGRGPACSLVKKRVCE